MMLSTVGSTLTSLLRSTGVMKSKLITLSIVSLLFSSSAQAQTAQLPPTLQDPTNPAQNVLPTPPDQIDKTHPHDADQIDVPDELKQHRDDFEKVKKQTVEFEEAKLLKDENVDEKWRKYMEAGAEELKENNFSAAASKYKRALTQAEKAEEKQDLLQAITNKRLGQSYLGREKYEEARDFLKSAREKFLKLGMKNDGINPLIAKISAFYKELDFHKFGEKVSKYFEDAKVERIRVFKEDNLTKFKVELASKFIREVDTEKVKKVKFDKTVTFNFRSLPNDHYGLENVEGLQVKTKKLWVNLLSSIVGLNAENLPEAKITGGKLGKEKTVLVKVPEKIYDQGKSILEEFKLAIDSTKYDAELVSPKAESAETDSSTTADGDQSFDKKPETLKELKEKGRDKPVDVIHSIDEPVKPESLSPAEPYNEVIDNHLNEDKPPVRTR